MYKDLMMKDHLQDLQRKRNDKTVSFHNLTMSFPKIKWEYDVYHTYSVVNRENDPHSIKNIVLQALQKYSKYPKYAKKFGNDSENKMYH